MTPTLSYKGYAARIEFDGVDRILTGRIAGINDVVGFHADDVAGVERAFHEAVDDYLATCAAIGRAPERTYSGKVMLRVSPDMHARIARQAQLSGMSLNQFGEELLSRGLAESSAGR